jgi:hypothetical protein
VTRLKALPVMGARSNCDCCTVTVFFSVCVSWLFHDDMVGSSVEKAALLSIEGVLPVAEVDNLVLLEIDPKFPRTTS